jgi:hypothetical protein
MSFAFFLQFLNINFDVELNKIEVILAILALLLILIPFPILMFYILNFWSSEGGLAGDNAKKIYGTLYDGLILNAIMK